MPASADPTPEEISERCREIQRTWTADEERKRRKWSIAEPVEVTVGNPSPVFAPGSEVNGRDDV